MRIAAISDLHIDINRGYPVAECLAQALRSASADMLLIAGDISEDYAATIAWISSFEDRTGVPVYYVPGNHDLWKKGNLGNDGIYSLYDDDPHCLCSKAVCIGDWAIIGDAGWYDYTLSPLQWDKARFDEMSYGSRIWQDRLRNSWTDDNIARTDMMLGRLRKALADAAGRNIIAVTHMLVNDDFTVKDKSEEWDYFSAFLGSARIGSLFMHSGVRYSISGHVHYRMESSHDGTVFICPCLGYFSEWKLYGKGHDDDAGFHIADAMRIITI